MNRKTIYIAGPMKGYEDNNRRAFTDAEWRLGEAGWHVVNPANFDAVFGKADGKLLDACMEAELAAIPHLDAIYLLKGWERSEGARKELLVALQCKKMILVEGADGETAA